MELVALLGRGEAVFEFEVAGEMAWVRHSDIEADLVDVVVGGFDEMFCFVQTLSF